MTQNKNTPAYRVMEYHKAERIVTIQLGPLVTFEEFNRFLFKASVAESKATQAPVPVSDSRSEINALRQAAVGCAKAAEGFEGHGDSECTESLSRSALNFAQAAKLLAGE